MKKTAKDIQVIRAMNSSEMGQAFIDYCERALAELFKPEVLTAENLEAHKVAAAWVKEHIISPIKMAKVLGVPKPGEFE